MFPASGRDDFYNEPIKLPNLDHAATPAFNATSDPEIKALEPQFTVARNPPGRRRAFMLPPSR